MKFPFLNTSVPLTHQGRKYPIQRDEEGQSLRQRCFRLFKQGKNAREAAEFLDMKLATAHRYYSEWNQCPPALEATYKYLKKELKKKGGLSPRIIGILHDAMGMPEWEIVDILSRPNGLKSLLMGKFMEMRKQQLYSKQEQRLEAALRLVVFLEQTGVPLEWIHREINQLMQRAINYANAHKGEDQGEVFDES